MLLVILIDLDDTLTDRAAAFELWARDFLARNSVSIDRFRELEAIDRRGITPRPAFLAQAFDLLGLDLDFGPELAGYRMSTGSPPLQEGVVDRLDAIRAAGGKVVVLSNGIAEVQRRKLAANNLLGRVDAVVISEEAGIAKPDPGIYHLASAQVGATAGTDNIWMIGDNQYTDIRGAIDAGIRTVWVNPYADPWAGPGEPDAVVTTTAAGLDHIRTMSR